MKIVYDQEIPYINEFFSTQGELLSAPSNTMTADLVHDADVLFVRSVTHINQELLDNSSVRFVGSATAGIDHIDRQYLEKANIAWAYAPGCNAKAVSDYVILSVAHLIQAGILKNQNCTAGVIGIGHVGQQVVNALTQLGFEVIVNDPPRAKKEDDFASTPLDQFYDLDLVCLHTPLITTGQNPTFHLLNHEFLSQFNPKGILLNAGRGACIDTNALKNSKISAVLDVWENEPAIDPELAQSTFIATPHIAGYSQAAKYRATKQVYEAFCNHFEVDYYNAPEENPLDFFPIDHTALDWTEQLFKVDNLMNLSNAFKQELLKQPSRISDVFKALRKQYPFRREIMLA